MTDSGKPPYPDPIRTGNVGDSRGPLFCQACRRTLGSKQRKHWYFYIFETLLYSWNPCAAGIFLGTFPTTIY